MSRDFLQAHLKLWKDSGIPAPANELQSIQGWLQYLGRHGAEETKSAMRKRMILLMQEAHTLYDEGPEAEDAAGIYEHRPEMRIEHEQQLSKQAAERDQPTQRTNGPLHRSLLPLWIKRLMGR